MIHCHIVVILFCRFDNAIYNVEIRENTTYQRPIITVRATDPDLGDNGAVTYAFAPSTVDCCSSTFRLDVRTGDIFLQHPLNYEKQSMYTLQVAGSDLGAGSVTSTAKVIIKVTDVNDNAPQIVTNGETGDVTVSVPESLAPEAFVAHVSVTDSDSARNGDVECALTENDEFAMEQMYTNEYKVITTRMLDRETQTRYHLEVICHDHGLPRLTSSITVDVEVIDVNDNAPVFTQVEYFVTMAENSAPGTQILKVEARDPDSGRNGTVSYKLDHNPGNIFTVDLQSGVIRTTINIDREQTETLVFSVVAQDMGHDSKSSSAIVTVTVTDVDDQPPRFTQRNYVFTVDENLQPDTEVGTVMATDLDLPPNNIYSFYFDPQYSPIDALRIDAKSGVIFTRKPFDREDVPSFNAIVIVQSDSGSALSDRTNVIIYVKDKNDNSPIINFPAVTNGTVQLNNRAPIGHFVTRVEANDLDYGSNADLTYMITGGDPTSIFLIDAESGVIMVNSDLSAYDQQTFALNLLVKDGGTPSRVASSVLFVLINSSAPLYISGTLTDVSSKHTLSASKQTTNLLIGTYMAAIICAAIATCLLLILVVTIIVCLRSKRQHAEKRDDRDPAVTVRLNGMEQAADFHSNGLDLTGLAGMTADPWEERHHQSRIYATPVLDKLSVDVPDITLSLCPLQNSDQRVSLKQSFT